MAGRLPDHPDDIRTGLVEAGERLKEANRAHQAAILDIADWLRKGEAAVPISEMARLAGITRRTARRLLGPEN